MGRVWQLQEAKNKLSEIVNEAASSGPQIITRRGVEVAVVLAYDEFTRLRGSRDSLADFFRKSPLAEITLDRDNSLPREIEL